jgi:hypothetical protein
MFKFPPPHIIVRRPFATNRPVSIAVSGPVTVHNMPPPPDHTTVSPEDGVSMLRSMMTIRRMEMAADALYKERAIRGFCHLAIGQVI